MTQSDVDTARVARIEELALRIEEIRDGTDLGEFLDALCMVIAFGIRRHVPASKQEAKLARCMTTISRAMHYPFDRQQE